MIKILDKENKSGEVKEVRREEVWYINSPLVRSKGPLGIKCQFKFYRLDSQGLLLKNREDTLLNRSFQDLSLRIRSVGTMGSRNAVQHSVIRLC